MSNVVQIKALEAAAERAEKELSDLDDAFEIFVSRLREDDHEKEADVKQEPLPNQM